MKVSLGRTASPLRPSPPASFLISSRRTHCWPPGRRWLAARWSHQTWAAVWCHPDRPSTSARCNFFWLAKKFILLAICLEGGKNWLKYQRSFGFCRRGKKLLCWIPHVKRASLWTFIPDVEWLQREIDDQMVHELSFCLMKIHYICKELYMAALTKYLSLLLHQKLFFFSWSQGQKKKTVHYDTCQLQLIIILFHHDSCVRMWDAHTFLCTQLLYKLYVL